MKILFLNTNIGYGGASKMLVWVANRAAGAGHDVSLLTYRIEDENQKLKNGVKHIHCQIEEEGGKKHLLKSVLYIRRLIKKEDIDVAVAFLSPSQLRLSLAALGTKTKLLFSHRGDPTLKTAGGWKNKILSAINSWAFRQADFYVFQTKQAEQAFSPIIQSRSLVIPNPITPLFRTTQRATSMEKRIVCVGRLDIRQKRQDLLIESFKRISVRYPDYTLELYGDGPDDEKLRVLAGDCSQIYFMGKTSDVVSAVQNASMLVLSSDFEGIPNALLEAMSLGVPCISTDCTPGGAAMLIQDNQNGLLVPRGNADALASAMEWFIEHPREREAMGVAGKQVNVLFAEDSVGKEWMRVFDRLKS